MKGYIDQIDVLARITPCYSVEIRVFIVASNYWRGKNMFNQLMTKKLGFAIFLTCFMAFIGKSFAMEPLEDVDPSKTDPSKAIPKTNFIQILHKYEPPKVKTIVCLKKNPSEEMLERTLQPRRVGFFYTEKTYRGTTQREVFLKHFCMKSVKVVYGERGPIPWDANKDEVVYLKEFKELETGLQDPEYWKKFDNRILNPIIATTPSYFDNRTFLVNQSLRRVSKNWLQCIDDNTRESTEGVINPIRLIEVLFKYETPGYAPTFYRLFNPMTFPRTKEEMQLNDKEFKERNLNLREAIKTAISEKKTLLFFKKMVTGLGRPCLYGTLVANGEKLATIGIEVRPVSHHFKPDKSLTKDYVMQLYNKTNDLYKIKLPQRKDWDEYQISDEKILEIMGMLSSAGL